MFLKTYTPGAISVLASQGASAIGGFVALFCLTNMLSKDDFGAYSFVFSLLIVLSTLGTLGLDRALLLKLAGEGGGDRRFRGRNLLMAALRICLPVSAGLALLLVLVAEPLASAMGSSVALWWLQALAVAIVPMTALVILKSWFQANHRISVSAVMPGVVDAIRALVVVLAFWAMAGKLGVAVAVMAGCTLPVLWLFAWSRGAAPDGPTRVDSRDLARGSVYALQRISETGFNQIDLILIGLVATDAVTAEFAVAARLAALADIGRMAITPTFLPRARLYLKDGNASGLADEYRMSQALALLVALAACFVMLVAGPTILSLFGSFGAAYAPLLILSAAFLAGAAAGPHLPYLTMTGTVQWPALIRLGALFVSGVGLVVVVPQWGAVGAAWVILGVSGLMHGAALFALWAKTGFWGLGGLLLLAAAIAVAGILAVAVGFAPAWAAIISLGLASLLVALPVAWRFRRRDAADVS